MAERRIHDRYVLLVAAAVVVGVIAFAWFTDFVPGLRSLITSAPVVIVGMVAVTVFILVLALRPRHG